MMYVAANNVCDSSGAGDSICSSGSDDHTTGYSAVLHANSYSGNVYIEGIQGANNSSATPSTDAMCLKSDKTQDVSGLACQSDNIDNFIGISAYAPGNAPDTWANSGNPWPLTEISDTPTF